MIPLCACSQIRFVLEWWDCNNCSRKFSCLLSKEARQISDFASPGWEASPLGLLSTQQLRTIERQCNVEEFEGMTEKEVEEFFLMRTLQITVKVRTQCNS